MAVKKMEDSNVLNKAASKAVSEPLSIAAGKPSTQAKNQQDVDNMSVKDRLYDSLTYSYGKKKEASDASYDKAISQQDRALLGRGMQRSSYGMQTLSGLQNQKIQAGNDIESEKIADYENRLYQIERDEKADEQWERQFAEGQRQFNENLGFQKSESERQQGNWEKEFEAGRSDAAQAQQNWEKEYEAGRADADQAQKNWEAQFAFTQKQWEAQQDQWKQEFDYNQKTDDQKLAYNYVVSILGNGGNPSDELLARAGLSRADANSMKTQVQQAAAGNGGGGYTRGTTKGSTTTGTTDTPSDSDLDDALNVNIKDRVRTDGSAGTGNTSGGLITSISEAIKKGAATAAGKVTDTGKKPSASTIKDDVKKGKGGTKVVALTR